MTEQTLQQLLVERVSAYAMSDRPRELLDEGIDKMFKDLVQDLCRSYGDLSKHIKEAMSLAMPANIGEVFELNRYNALIAEQLRMRWEQSALESVVLANADKAIAELLEGGGAITGEVSLRALLQEFIDAHKDQAAEERWSRPEIRFVEKDTHGASGFSVYFDPEPEGSYRSSLYSSSGRNDHSLKHSLHAHLTEEVRPAPDQWSDEVRVGEVYHARLDEKKVCLSLNIRSKWERMLAELYYGNAKLLVDCDPSDFSYGFDY
ncbi:hypothetical protein ACUTAH_02880 [Metapseudomonas furukawaii]|uniref:hypothetical protein n=1 Tax=Metapseudomonas furukawaii TaxID=1149133 RepID=UPI004046754C